MKVSVALCTYNGEAFLSQQLESIFAQTDAVDEIVVCDDCSKDATVDIISSYSNRYPGIIQLYINEANLRVVKNFEKAVQLCTGDVIFFCDQDDIWEHDKVEKTVLFFENNPQMLGVFTDARLIDDNAAFLGITLWEMIFFKEFAKPGKDIFTHIFLHGNVVTGACLVVRKEALPIILPFEKSAYLLHDELTALKLSKLGRLGMITEPLTRYRLHKNQASNPASILNRAHENETRRNIINGHAASCPLDYYRYFKKRAELIQKLMPEGFVFGDDKIALLNKERKKGMLAYLHTLPFIERKKNLLSLFISRKEGISFGDIFAH